MYSFEVSPRSLAHVRMRGEVTWAELEQMMADIDAFMERAQPFERVRASLHWGGRLLGVGRIGSGLIDHGLHFKVEVDVW